VTLLDQVYGAWLRGDVEAGLDLCTDDIVYRDQALGRETRGKDDLREWVKSGHERVKDWKVEFDSSFGDAEHCAAEARMSGVLIQDLANKKASDEPFFTRYAIFGTIRDGRLSRIMIYWNPHEWE
jgi:steroid delta-isomerase-like uncharacterized protein